MSVIISSLTEFHSKEKQLFRVRRCIVISWHRFYDPTTGRYISADPIGLAGGINLYAYANQNPIYYIDPDGRLVFALPFIIPAISAGHLLGGTIVAGIGAWMFNEMTSDEDLQKEIEEGANKEEYKRICSEKKPPGLTGCELAKWKLRKAINCKAARDENTRRWWGGEDNRHDPQLHSDNDRAIQDALADVERLCKCEPE